MPPTFLDDIVHEQANYFTMTLAHDTLFGTNPLALKGISQIPSEIAAQALNSAVRDHMSDRGVSTSSGPAARKAANQEILMAGSDLDAKTTRNKNHSSGQTNFGATNKPRKRAGTLPRATSQAYYKKANGYPALVDIKTGKLSLFLIDETRAASRATMWANLGYGRYGRNGRYVGYGGLF